MVKGKVSGKLSIILALAIVSIVMVSGCTQPNGIGDGNNTSNGENGDNGGINQEQRIYCTDEERAADVCTLEYVPVCGWSDPSQVQCLAWPCASTFSNRCAACGDPTVLYITQGQCPVDSRGCEALCKDQNYNEGTCKSSKGLLATDYELDITCVDDTTQCSRIEDCKCACSEFAPPEIDENVTDFDSCIVAGGALLESDPRQCIAPDGRRFTEGDVDIETATLLTGDQARTIAEASNCVENGTLGDTVAYNQVTKTWWFDIDIEPNSERPGCSPACVIWDETNATEINWRCTGLIVE
jgi:hypothetical protein